jgi:hypothetical protein
MIEGDMKVRAAYLSNTQFHVTPYPVTVHHVAQSVEASGADF